MELDIPQKEFERYLNALENEASITERYESAKIVLRKASDEKAKFNSLELEMKSLKAEVGIILHENQWTERLRDIEREMFPNSSSNRSAVAKEIMGEAARASSSAVFYRNKISGAKAAHKTIDTLKAYEHYKEAVKKRGQQWQKYALFYGQEPVVNLVEWGHIDEPLEERTACNTADSVYKTQFDNLVNQHVTDRYKFEYNKDFDELCVAVLPHILGKNRPAGASNIEAFTKYMNDINEKNKGLNTRKLQRIREILDDVHAEVGTRLHSVRAIDLFLNREEREITGGHRVRLEQKPSRQYPPKWLTDYAERMPVDGSLFVPEGETIEDLTAAGISLEEKMREAFYKLGGDRTSKASIEKLLNPNSYFDLTFSIKSQAQNTNKGSTGQTYTAVALLCIARLSRVGQGSQAGNNSGLRFMPIDEAEGLGTNYDMLHKVAKDFDYQIISMSINPLTSSATEGRYLYGLRKNPDSEEDVNLTPMAVFEDAVDETGDE